MFPTRRHHRRHRDARRGGAASAWSGSAGPTRRAHRRCARSAVAEPARAAARHVRDGCIAPGPGIQRSGRGDRLSRAAVVHRRGRRRDFARTAAPSSSRASCAPRSQRGARLAEPGEFTLRAFLNGKLDLVQAEAVADLIDAVTPLQARAAFDQLEGTLTTRDRGDRGRAVRPDRQARSLARFSRRGLSLRRAEGARDRDLRRDRAIDALLAHGAARGRLVREGAAGGDRRQRRTSASRACSTRCSTPNRAIVTPIPGTTRDLLTERADIGGISVGAGRHRGRARDHRRRRAGRRRARAARCGRRRPDDWSCSIDRARSARTIASCSAPPRHARASSCRTRSTCRRLARSSRRSRRVDRDLGDDRRRASTA